MSIAEDNKRYTRDFIDAMSRSDLSQIVDTYDEDGRVHTMGNTLISGIYDKAQMAQFAGGVLETFPEGITFTILTMTAEDDRVSVEATSEGKHVSGKMYRNHYHFLFTWRDGKLLEMKEFMDTEVVTDILCGGQRPGE